MLIQTVWVLIFVSVRNSHANHCGDIPKGVKNILSSQVFFDRYEGSDITINYWYVVCLMT